MTQPRQMQQEDIKAVADLWRNVYKTEHASLSDEKLDSLHSLMLDECLPKAVAASVGYVYEIDGNIIGFITLDPGMAGHYVDNLYTSSEHEGHDVGTKLVEKMQKLYDNLSLHVFEHAARAIKLYEERWGFRRVCDKVGKNNDKIFMEWFRD